MPGGQGPIGFAAFTGVKFAGYTAAAWYLNRTYSIKARGPWIAGAARTGLGLAVGVTYGLL